MWPNLENQPHRVRLVVGLVILQFGALALAAPSAGQMSARGVSVLDLQFMRTPEKATEYIVRLGPSGVDAAQLNLYLDLAYLVLYGLALSAACIVLAARLAELGRTGIAALGRRMAGLALVGAGLDAVEDVAILVVLGGSVDQPWPAIAFGFAVVKWLALMIVLGYLLVALVLVLRSHDDEETVEPATD